MGRFGQYLLYQAGSVFSLDRGGVPDLARLGSRKTETEADSANCIVY